MDYYATARQRSACSHSRQHMSYLIVENHNIDAYLTALEAAHDRYLLPTEEAMRYCPEWLIRARDGIHRVFSAENAMTEIAKHQEYFDMLNQRIDPLTMDDFQECDADFR